jgi:hypothetical protein
MHFTNQFSFDDVLFILNIFDTTLMYFLSHIFHFLYVTNVVLSFQKSIMSP